MTKKFVVWYEPDQMSSSLVCGRAHLPRPRRDPPVFGRRHLDTEGEYEPEVVVGRM